MLSSGWLSSSASLSEATKTRRRRNNLLSFHRLSHTSPHLPQLWKLYSEHSRSCANCTMRSLKRPYAEGAAELERYLIVVRRKRLLAKERFDLGSAVSNSLAFRFDTRPCSGDVPSLPKVGFARIAFGVLSNTLPRAAELSSPFLVRIIASTGKRTTNCFQGSDHRCR